MRIYKKTYTDTDGKEKDYQKWYIEISDHRGKARRFSGYKDKRATEKLGEKIEKLVRCKKLNESLPVDLAQWLEVAPRTQKEHFLKIGLLDAREAQAGKPLKTLLTEYIESRKIRGCCLQYRNEIEIKLNRLFQKTKCTYWTDIDSQKIERFMAEIQALGKSFKTVNDYLIYFKGFHNWLLDNELIARPLPGLRKIKKLDTRLDRRKVRRALTIEELRSLLQAAKIRPLQEAELINRGQDKGIPGAKLTPETIDKLELLGIERALVYETAFYTGLRRNELASICVRDVLLNCPTPRIILKPENEKAGRGCELPLRSDLAAEIKDFINRKGLSPENPLFNMPNLRTFKRDLTLAGIEYEKDENGRTVDFHGLRTSFATHLSRSGVHPRIAQAALRHSDIKLTMQVYTDPQLLDVSGAVDKLPGLSDSSKQAKTA